MGEKKEETKQNQLTVRHKTSPTFVNYTSDGAYGSLTPDGDLSMDFYVTKGSTPDVEIYDLDEKGKPIGQPKYQGFKGITKEKQFGLIMHINRVIELRNWLNSKIDEAVERGFIDKEKAKSPKKS